MEVIDKILSAHIPNELAILRQVARETSREEVERLNLVMRLIEANGTAWTNGCGLAAIQIGVPLRMAWLVINGYPLVLINPRIEYGMGEYEVEEGCLSIPNKKTRVKRYDQIEYWNDGKLRKASGFKANVIQHEIDHMDGILNIDKEIV